MEITRNEQQNEKNIFLMNQRANKLRKEKNYESAFRLYEEIWSKSPDEWTAAGYMNCARKLGKFDEGLVLGEELLKFYPNFEWGKNEYALLLYEKYVANKKKENLDIADFEKIIDNIFEIIENNFIKIMSILKISGEFKRLRDWGKVLYWLNKINLEDIPESGKTEKNNLLSLKERWLLLKIKALFEENEDNLDEIADEFMELIEFGKENYPKNVHFFRWEGLLLNSQKRYQDAIIIYEKILRNFRTDWYVKSELAELYFNSGYISKAKKVCSEVLNSKGQLKMKINTVKLLSEILTKEGEVYNSKVLLSLYRAIKEKNKWKCDKELIKKTDEFYKRYNYSQIYEKSQKIWSGGKVEAFSSEKLNGKIVSVLPNGFAGFILGNNRKTYYFNFKDIFGSKEDFKVGAKVCFTTGKGFDKKKNRETVNAIKVKLT